MEYQNKNRLIFWAFTIIALLLAGGAYFYFQNTTAPLTTQPATATSTTETAADGTTCHDSAKYFVIEKNRTDSVGSDVLVKYKTSPNQHIDCAYFVDKSDYEILNGENGAQYFFAVTGNFLLMDNGTGPEQRELTIFDLNKRTQVFADEYTGTRDIGINGTLVQYWTTTPSHTNGVPIIDSSGTAEPATQANCPEFEQYRSDGLTPSIVAHVSLDLSTLVKTDSGQRRCDAQQ
jgi:hypothetical protein